MAWGTEHPFSLEAPEHHFHVDPLPMTVSEFFQEGSFSIYLLGHDACADHRISLVRSDDAGAYRLEWSGRIALAYVGKEAWERSFRVEAEGVRFDGISLWYLEPERAHEYLGVDLDPKATWQELLAPYVAEPARYRLEERDGRRFAVPT